MNLHKQMDTFKAGEETRNLKNKKNIFFGTNPVYELKPKQGTDDLILRNSSWLWLRKIKKKALTIDRICGSVFHLNGTNRRSEAFPLHCWAELDRKGGSQTLSLEWGVLSPAVRLLFSLQRAGCCGLNVRCHYVFPHWGLGAPAGAAVLRGSGNSRWNLTAGNRSLVSLLVSQPWLLSVPFLCFLAAILPCSSPPWWMDTWSQELVVACGLHMRTAQSEESWSSEKGL